MMFALGLLHNDALQLCALSRESTNRFPAFLSGTGVPGTTCLVLLLPPFCCSESVPAPSEWRRVRCPPDDRPRAPHFGYSECRMLRRGLAVVGCPRRSLRRPCSSLSRVRECFQVRAHCQERRTSRAPPGRPCPASAVTSSCVAPAAAGSLQQVRARLPAFH